MCAQIHFLHSVQYVIFFFCCHNLVHLSCHLILHRLYQTPLQPSQISQRAQLLNKLSAVTTSLASTTSSMVTPQQAASAQCVQSALSAMQDLNSRSDILIICHARKSDESREFNKQFRRVCEGVQDSEHQKDE